MPKFKAPADASGIFVAGVPYNADENGVVEIAEEHAHVAAANGFELIPDDEPAAAAAPAVKPPKQPEQPSGASAE